MSTTLRRGWTTGACATAATSAACEALFTGRFPESVRIALPGGQKPEFDISVRSLGPDSARAGVVKDAGDDPDVTHGALIMSQVTRNAPGAGISFHAGEGVGVVTMPGLPLPVGEPAINPVPRKMMSEAATKVAACFGVDADLAITVSVEGGEELAQQTWNPRLGIVGGISILGTTGIVIPYSCSAWIDSIHRGIDVSRAAGEKVIAGCTGAASEARVKAILSLPDHAMIDMGDFAGGMLKYLRTHPVPTVYIGGGFAKMSKLARGHLDLHSGRSQVDFSWLAGIAAENGPVEGVAERIAEANTAAEALAIATENRIALGNRVAALACNTAMQAVRGASIAIGILVFDRSGALVGRVDARS